MITKRPTQIATFSDCFGKCVAMEVPVDAGGDGVVLDVWTGVRTSLGIKIAEAIVTRVGETMPALIGFLARTIICFATDVGVGLLVAVDADMMAAAIILLVFIGMGVLFQDSSRPC